MVRIISVTRSDNSNAISVGTGIAISPSPRTGYTDNHANRMAYITNAEINTKINDTILNIFSTGITKNVYHYEKSAFDKNKDR